MIFVKNSRGGREVNMRKTLSKINLSKIGLGGREVNLNLDNVFNYTGFFLKITSYASKAPGKNAAIKYSVA